ncbi:MAG: hypothetical protein ACR2MP_05715, partial [Streptosporangiaceae bacterium]
MADGRSRNGCARQIWESTVGAATWGFHRSLTQTCGGAPSRKLRTAAVWKTHAQECTPSTRALVASNPTTGADRTGAPIVAAAASRGPTLPGAPSPPGSLPTLPWPPRRQRTRTRGASITTGRTGGTATTWQRPTTVPPGSGRGCWPWAPAVARQERT